MFGRKKNAEKKPKNNDRESVLERIESGSIVNNDWQMPEMIAKRKRDAVGELIAGSPDQAASVLRGWLSSDLDK